MGTEHVRMVLAAHNEQRLLIAGILARVRELNEGARQLSKIAWHQTDSDAESALYLLSHDFDEALVKVNQINERAQDKAMEIIQALGS